MFGGIAAAEGRILFGTASGEVLTLDAETGHVVGEFSRSPIGPADVHVTACAVQDDTVLLADAAHDCVRRFRLDGLPIERIGRRPTPGYVAQDEDGVFEEPCALLPLDGELLVGCGGLDIKHGVHGAGGRFVNPVGSWQRVQGLARIEDEIWVAETDAGRIWRFHIDGRYIDRIEPGGDLGRPFRLAFDGFDGVLAVFAPDSEEQQGRLGVAHMTADGSFAEWRVPAGDDPGKVFCPFDIAALPDGRFAVADLPTAGPPDVRVQLFSPDGRWLRTFFEDRVDLNAALRVWCDELRAEGTAYERARVHHLYSGGAEEERAKARELYREVLAEKPGHLMARLNLAALLEPADAEEQYRAALEHGGDPGNLAAKIAECRADRDDLDGAIEILRQSLEGPQPPEEVHRYLELLGTWFLRRAGEDE
ncbi:MAG: NHL repeat-containing protein [Planctomycetota bacterium]